MSNDADHPTPQERYQVKPFFGSSHTWALTHLRDLPAGARVLDIGPGSGLVGQHLSERGGFHLDAVEISAEARAHVAPYYNRVEETLEPFLGEQYDLVVLLDVLEHLTNPFEFYGRIWRMTAPGGRVLISVPNIAHWSIRGSLLFGFFEYTNRGLLDRTHYSFFNHRRLTALLRAHTDGVVEERAGSIPPLEFVLPKPVWDNGAFRLFSRLHLGAARVWQGLFAYQLLAAVRKAA